MHQDSSYNWNIQIWKKQTRGLWWTKWTDIAVWAISLSYWNMAAACWKWSVGSHTHSSCPRRHCKRYDRAINDISLRAAENEDQIHSCPRREKKDGRVLSLAWMKPRWKPAWELDYWGVWYQGIGLDNAQNAYHSPPGAATVTVWKSLEVLVYSRNRLKLLQTLNSLDDKAAGPGMQGLHKKRIPSKLNTQGYLFVLFLSFSGQLKIRS